MINWTTNGSHTFWEYFTIDCLKHDPAWTVISSVAYVTILVMGLLGNLAVIVVIGKHSYMRTVTNIFILNLAVADLFVVLFCVPCALFVNLFKAWLFPEILCKALPYTQGVSVCASVYTLVAISFDRCATFYRPVGKAAYGLSKFQAKIVILLIWIFAVVVTSPWLFVFKVMYSQRDFDFGNPHCFEMWDNPLFGNIYFICVPITICFVLPLLAICFLNLMIGLNMRRFERMALDHQYNIAGVTKLLCMVSITFLVCWTPLLVFTTKLQFFGPLKFSSGEGDQNESDKAIEEMIMAAAQLLGSFNSCVNPILYAFHNVRFRNCVKSFMKSCKK